MREYTFKSAPMRRSATWGLKEGYLLKRGADHALKLSEVTSAAWGDLTYRGPRNAWLHLTGPNGVVKVECNDAGVGDDRETFLRLCKAICESLASENPDLAIRQGGGRALRWSMFLIGVLAALFGLFFLWAGLTGNLNRNEMTAIGLGGFMLVAFGALAWVFAPWQAVQTLSTREMALYLGGMTAPMDGPDYDA